MNDVSVMRMVFSNIAYIGIAVALSAIFFVIFNALDGYLFFSPFFAFHVPPDSYPNFVLSIAIIVLLSIVISMNVYSFRNMKAKLKESSTWLSGSFIATASGVCGCTSVGFAIISSFGSAGIAASSFLTNYQIPLKIVSLMVLVFAYYSIRNNMIKSCAIRKN
jgi:hypothetical protein